MRALDNLAMYLRFAFGLKAFTRKRLTLDEARDIIKRRLAERETNFLRVVKRGIFEYAQSPYLPLLKLAGCQYTDLRDLVKRRGLEAALFELREAGVYIGFEEFKGRKPIIRPGLEYKVSTSAFENPYNKAHYQVETGGSTGVGRRIPMELDYLGEQAPPLMLARHTHGCLDTPTLLWRGPIPDGTGVNHIVRAIRYNRLPEKWHTIPMEKNSPPPRLEHRLATWCFVNSLRFYGVPVPPPRPLGLDRVLDVARWASRNLKRRGSCCVMTYVGMAIRICMAAQQAGLDLTGATFLVGSEPLTTAKARVITDTGAAILPTFASFEFGQVASGCLNAHSSDDMHLAKDIVALITYPLTLPGGQLVNALNFSSLLPSAPLILLNVQMDDHAIVEEFACGCPMGELGYDQHISRISSYSKLVSEGVTLIGSDVLNILENALPAKFGGSPLDYQLLEQEDAQGITRVQLVVSPSVRLGDVEELKSCFWESLNQYQESYKWAQRLWSQADTLEVLRQEPYTTKRGKHMTLWRQKTS